jgi:hypothetical protein
MEALSKAIDKLSSGKVPGADGNTSRIIKSGKTGLLEPLHSS